jgi:hypothetical protein
MVFIIFIGIVLASWLGLPLLPVIVVGALFQAAIAFLLTKNGSALRLAAGMLMVAAIRALLPQFSDPTTGALPHPFLIEWFTVGAYVSCVCLIACTFIGMFGPFHGRKPRVNRTNVDAPNCPDKLSWMSEDGYRNAIATGALSKGPIDKHPL